MHDLCDAVVLAIETDLPGHEVFYIASPDTIGGHPLAETVAEHYDGADIELRPIAREDASAISCAKAERLLGWKATRSWRDYLDDAGTGARVKTGAGQRPAPRSRPSASARGRSAAPGGSAGGGRRRRLRSPPSAARSSSASTGSTPRPCTASATRRRSCGRALAAVPAWARTCYVFTKCGRRWEGRPEGVIENDLRPESIREECEREPAAARRRAHRPLPGALARLDDGHAARGLLGDDGASSSTRARCAGSASPTSTSSSSRAARRCVTSTRCSPRSRCSREDAPGDRAPLGGRARNRCDLLLAARVGDCSPGAFDHERLAGSRRRRLAPRAPAFQEPARLAQPRPRRSPACGSRTSSGRRCRRSLWRGCSRSPASPRAIVGGRTPHHVEGWAAASDLGLGRRILGAIDDAIVASRRRLGRAARATAAHPPTRHRAKRGAHTMRLGLLSTANINLEILGGAAETDRVDVVAVASRDAARAEAYAAEHGIARAHGSYEALLARRRGRRRLHLAPERPAPRVDDARARRRASTSSARSRTRAVPAEVEEAFDARRDGGARGHGGVHVPPPPADARRSSGSSADGALGRVRLDHARHSRSRSPTWTNVRALPELDGGALMDVGCYCVSGSRCSRASPSPCARSR